MSCALTRIITGVSPIISSLFCDEIRWPGEIATMPSLAFEGVISNEGIRSPSSPHEELKKGMQS